jgi:hypothetical protein
METQKCSGCNKLKIISDFHSINDVPRKTCILCFDKRKVCCKKYRETHKEELKEINKKYRETHEEEIREYQQNYQENHKEKIREYQQNYKVIPAKKLKNINLFLSKFA